MIGGHPTTAGSFPESVIRLFQNVELIWLLTVDDLRRVYTRSVMGVSWVLLKPVLLVVLYATLFGFVFQARGGPSQTTMEYLLILLTGLLPWLALSDAVSAAASSIAANTSLVTKIVFPIEILPVIKVLGATASGLGGMVMLVVFQASIHKVGWTLVLLPLLLVAQLVFTIGLAWLVAAVNVALRDTSHVLPYALMVWMFMSPVVYSAEMVPKALAIVFSYNPMSYFLEGYRLILLANQPPTFLIWSVVTVTAVMIFLFGFWVLNRMRLIIGDII